MKERNNRLLQHGPKASEANTIIPLTGLVRLSW